MKTYKIICILIIFTGVLSLNGAEWAPGEFIVRLNDNMSRACINNLISSFESYELVERMDLSFKDNVRLFSFNPNHIDENVLKQQLKQNENVIHVELNYLYRTLEYIPNDPQFRIQWALRNTGDNLGTYKGFTWEQVVGADIKATYAWEFVSGRNIQYQNRDITVAVIDNSFFMDHHGINWCTQYAWNASNNTPIVQYVPLYGSHGTKVASIIGAKMNDGSGIAGLGFNNKIKVLPIHVGSGTSPTSINSAAVVRAYSYILTLRDLYVSSHGHHGANIVAINGSFGGGSRSVYLANRLAQAEERGIISVFGAGNNGTNNDLSPF